ncbi:SpoIIE family protein phosphatase [Streptomyces sp. DT193]|uniref:SpoIIE family protein phosphatase n=1 Tax=Streptomyces sp. DT193 TaxID=3393418 RepID=UPI003CF51DB0
MATVLFALLGQAHAQVAQLTRRLDALGDAPAPALADISATHLRLGRAQAQEADLQVQLTRAEAEREKAQNLADIAARRIQAIEAELHELRGIEEFGIPQVPDGVVQLIDLAGTDSDEDAALDQVDAALRKARHVLDREHETVEELAGELGVQSPVEPVPGVTVIPGQVTRQGQAAARSQGERIPNDELSGTTANNSQGGEAAAGTEIAIRADSSDRITFVGAATRRIARSRDLDEIVMSLCRATVPTFCDGILVYLRDRLLVDQVGPSEPFIMRLRRTDRIPEHWSSEDAWLPVDQEEPNFEVVATELCEVTPDGALAEILRGVRPVFGDTPAARAALPELLGKNPVVRSEKRVILAPLHGQRHMIGTAILLRSLELEPFQEDDLLVAAQLASHTALGIDRETTAHDREASISGELQRTMLPETLPRPTGVRLASRYLPPVGTARVGGDWYDAIPLPGSRVALVIGDVMGHSMTSAAIMGQLRTTAQTLAGLDLPPQEVLHHLDEQAQRLGIDRIATCLYAVYDPVSHRITIANAGHPPPVLLHLGGRAEVLRVPPGAPIGVGGVDFDAVELEAPAGSTLLLYTDGLVESRLRDVWTGVEQLREKLAATAALTGPDHPPPLEALCDEVLDMLGPGDRDDDIALLAARFDGIAPSDVAYWFLEPEDAAPGRARRLVRRALARWGMEDLTDLVELLVSEVVTNAVRYASGPVTLRLLRTDVLRCEVGDDVPQMPRLLHARVTDEAGRGLLVVNRLVRRWGATRLSTGKIVWFEVPWS